MTAKVKKRRAPDYARKIVNQVMRPLSSMLRKFERLGLGDEPAAKELRRKIKAVKDRVNQRIGARK